MKKHSPASKNKFYDCVGIGLCVSDYQCILDHYPEPDMKTELKKFVHQGGAPVPTAMVALGKWKHDIAFIGITGDDYDGNYIRREMESFGVDTSHMVIDRKSRTCRSFIWIDESRGTRAVVLDKTEARPLPSRVATPAALPHCRILHTDGRETPVALKAMRLTQKRGGTVVIDAGSPRDHMDDLFAATDHFVASHAFVRKYYGRMIKPETAIKRFLQKGPGTAIITLAEKGCIGATKDGGFFRVKGYSKPGFVVDTTGAGDVFHGGYIHGLLRGWSPEESARYANAAAFLSCNGPGARDSIPSLNKVTRLLKDENSLNS